MPKGRKAVIRKPLYEAVKFISLAQKSKGSDAQVYCMAHNNMLIAFDGVLALGTPIEESLSACPHTMYLRAALESAEPEFALTQVAQDRLTLRSGEFQASIPCCNGSGLTWVNPDAAVFAVDEAIIRALRICGSLVSDKAVAVLTSCVSLGPGSAVSTDRTVILEVWHDFKLPGTYLIPKAAIVALTKSKKKLIAMGFGNETVSFHFEDRSWLRTQIYLDRIPDVSQHLNVKTNTKPVPSDLYAAAAAVAPFSIDGRVLVNGQEISSWPRADTNARTALISEPMQPRIYPAQLLELKEYMLNYDSDGAATYFFAPGIRGAITHEIYHLPQSQSGTCYDCEKPIVGNDHSNCIPF